MVSGTFHPISQQWRYFSREKAIVHTLHLAQIPPYVTGQTVTIPIVPPTGTGASGGSSFRQGTQQYPTITPYRGVNITNVTNNIPPYWLDGGLSLNSGTYSFSGTLTTPGPTLNYQVETQWWPSSGGVFLFLGECYPRFYPSNAGQSDGSRVDLFNGAIAPDFQNGYPSLQSADFFIQMVGDNWINMTVNAYDKLPVSAIIQSVPPLTNLADWAHPSPFFNNGFSSWGQVISVIMRLGP